MCNTYTIILKCNHKQNYTYRCPLYLSAPRQKCVKTPPTIAHYFVSCRKCRGQDSDDFVVHWVERESESSAVGGKDGTWRKGEDINYMLAIGTFEIVANGDETGRVKGVRVYENGTEEARREKKGLKNVSLDLSGTNKPSFDAGPSHDIYDQKNVSTQELKLDGLRTQSLPIKGKPKKPNVFGSLRKMIVRPRSEQDTAATGEHKSPTQGTVKTKLNRFNTITGGFRGGKKSEDMEEEGSLSASADDRRVDDATGYEYLTPKEFLDLHFKGVVSGSSGTDATVSNAISTPIDIPLKRQGDTSQKRTAEKRAGEYMSEIGRNPFADNSAVVDSFVRDSAVSDVENSYQERTSDRWSHYTHSSGRGRMSLETEFSQADEERMEIITEAIDGDTINITPGNIDDVLAVWKGGFGTSTASSPIHIPPRPHVLSHSVHSRSIEALPILTPFRSQDSSLDVMGYSASLPNTQGDEKRIIKTQWVQENASEKVSSAPSATLQPAVDFVKPPGCFDMQQENNRMKEYFREFALPKRSNTGDAQHARCPPGISEESSSQGFALPKRSNTGDVPYSRQLLDKTNELPHGFSFPKRSNTENGPHPRHPLAHEITRNNSLASISRAPSKNQPALPDIQEPAQETIAGTRYSSLPSSPTTLSPPRKGKQSEQGRQSPRLWNGKGTPISKPEPRTNLLVPERTIDRMSTMTTISQFIPSRNEGADEEITTNSVSPSKTIKAPRRRMGSSNVQRPLQNPTMSIPDIPAIPKTYAKHVAVLPKIGRDASGRFSMEHINEDEPARMGKKELGEVSEEEQGEDSIDIYANHTIGTWDAALRNSPGDVSPLGSCEDLNSTVSPVSPVEGSVSGKAWDGEGRDGCMSGEMCGESPGLLSQLIHPSTVSPSQHLPLSILTPPQSPQSLHPPQHLHSPSQFSSSLQRTPQSTLSNTIPPISPLHIDPSIPLIRPLQIRKKIPAPASKRTETENLEEIEARRRQREQMDEEFRRADERLRRLRDGRGGL